MQLGLLRRASEARERFTLLVEKILVNRVVDKYLTAVTQRDG